MYHYALFLLTKSHAYSSTVVPSVLLMLDCAKNNSGFIGCKRQLRQREDFLAWYNADGSMWGIWFQLFLQLDWHKDDTWAGTSHPCLGDKSKVRNSAVEVTLQRLLLVFSLLHPLPISWKGYKNGTGLLYWVTCMSQSPSVLSWTFTRSRCLGKA